MPQGSVVHQEEWVAQAGKEKTGPKGWLAPPAHLESKVCRELQE